MAVIEAKISYGASTEISSKQGRFPTVPESQKHRLYDINVLSGLNQFQLRKTYTEADLQMLYNSGAAVEAI